MSEFLNDDDLHPIPLVNVIDVVVPLAGGGAYYVLVIAKPIKADERSKLRLRTKIEKYIGDFYSDSSRALQGTPKPGKMRIHVHIHRDSDPNMLQLIREHEPWMNENGIQLKIVPIDSDGKPTV